jgi:flagellar biosynthesis component FlhA
MKRLKFVSLTLLAGIMLISFTINTSAQPPQMPSPEEMAKNTTDQMKTACSLTTAQVSQVEAINLKYSKKMAEMFSQGPGGDFAEMQKKMEEMDTQKRAELQKILSADQLKKYDTMVAEQRKNMQGPPM